MKKTLLFITLILSSLIGFSQNVYVTNMPKPAQIAIMSGAAAGTTATYSVSLTSTPGTVGTIYLTTSSTFTSTATTDTIQVGYTDPGTGAITWVDATTNTGALAVLTLSAPSTTYKADLFGVLANYYRVYHVKGASSTGTISSVIQVR